MTKLVSKQNEWGKVVLELASEDLKLASYDNTLFELIGNVRKKKMLDYGCGPGVLAAALKMGGADVWAYDISKEMRIATANKIGADKVHEQLSDIQPDYYDAIICNLVLCIVEEEEVEHISKEMFTALKPDTGRIYAGFCNPHLLTVPETQLDFRPEPKCAYYKKHSYMKTKKEGMYVIIENHRPIEWYESMFAKTGFDVVAIHFTPTYQLNGKKIEDFIIFELKRGNQNGITK
ncbi:MAG: 2-polyprenyl-3-methyl-5-hydroxy-6-metoxy-1,4-benzoquinol methylase [Candidatus Woesearchaeota archaeon]|jgi:2-polyprenyl-3-methyl-5-hydroxy-6-metoxy-1,4-benzoquinol methylase